MFMVVAFEGTLGAEAVVKFGDGFKAIKGSIMAISNESQVVEELPMESWKDIVAMLEAHNGVCTVKLEMLRDIDGYGRLGPNVLDEIMEKLNSLGVSTIRETLPMDASASIVLMRKGTPAAELVALIKNLPAHEGEEGHTADELRKLNMVPEPVKVGQNIIDALHALEEAIESVNV